MSETLERAARYLIHRPLAAGGMGEIYLGSMAGPAGDRPIAVKRVPAGRLVDRAAVGRLVAEARLGFRLTHGNICQVLDLVLVDEGAYLVLEFVDGLDLRALIVQALRAGETIDPAVVLYVGREVARALDYAHRLTDASGRSVHVVHGDVTPRNILLSLEGEVKLADFGIARALGAAAPGTDVVAGTRGYIAPEVLAGAFDHRSDVYSLGATLHFALLGCPPRGPGDLGLLRERTDLAPDLVSIVERALAPRPEQRHLTAGQLEQSIAYELARRHPQFTPGVVAALVRRLRRPDERASTDLETRTLFTLVSNDGLAADPEPAETITGPRMPTMTAPALTSTAPRARRWPRRALLALPVVAAAAFASVLIVGASDSPRAIAAAPVAEVASAVPTVTSLAVAAPASDAPAETAEVETPPPSRRSPARRSHRGRPPPEARTAGPAYLSINANPWGAVEVDGRRVAAETPVYRLEVEPGRRRVAVVFGDGTRSGVKVLELRSGESRSLGFRR
jgi:serine/threonine protein kinase